MKLCSEDCVPHLTKLLDEMFGVKHILYSCSCYFYHLAEEVEISTSDNERNFKTSYYSAMLYPLVTCNVARDSPLIKRGVMMSVTCERCACVITWGHDIRGRRRMMNRSITVKQAKQMFEKPAAN
jgi:hypothetical protein